MSAARHVHTTGGGRWYFAADRTATDTFGGWLAHVLYRGRHRR